MNFLQECILEVMIEVHAYIYAHVQISQNFGYILTNLHIYMVVAGMKKGFTWKSLRNVQITPLLDLPCSVDICKRRRRRRKRKRQRKKRPHTLLVHAHSFSIRRLIHPFPLDYGPGLSTEKPVFHSDSQPVADDDDGFLDGEGRAAFAGVKGVCGAWSGVVVDWNCGGRWDFEDERMEG